MNRLAIYLLLFSYVLLVSCSSGKKAYERGDYYESVVKSVQRLRQNPDHSKSQETLKSAYPLALEVFESQATNAIASNAPFKFKNALQAYGQINQLYEQIRQCPGCLKVVQPKNFYTEIAPLKERAADESYNAGITALMKGTRNDAKQAYFNFVDANGYVTGYKDVIEYLEKSKWEATLKVVVEQIPVPARYNLSGQFFQDKVEEFLHKNYPDQGFVKFYTDDEAKTVKLEKADQILKIQFDDFSVGNTNLKEKEETVTKDSVRVGETKIDGKVVPVYNTVKAKVITYRKEVVSTGLLSVMVVDANTNGVLSHRKFPGQFTWVNSWARYNGDERALTKQQLALANQKELQPPQAQDLFLELTRPIYDQLVPAIRDFYASY
ncbi:MAG TPA: hypothetical protein VEB86_12915 [Chryseosolibacter sp.]|nr:hypothetical protein [Chryseosolibacter sp.]